MSSAAEDAAASTKVAEALGAAALAAGGPDLKSDRVAVELERLILVGELVPGPAYRPKTN